MPLFALRVGVFASTLACSLVAFSVQAAGTISYTYTYTYTDLGQPASVDGPRTDISEITHYAYDAQGNLTTVTNAFGQSVTLASTDSLKNAHTMTEPHWGTVN